MHPYLVIYISILTLSLFEIFVKWNSKIRRTVYAVVWFSMALFSGTRVCTGGDWIDYGNLFKRESEGTFKLISESGYELLFRLIAHVSSNLGFRFEHFLLIIALATSYLIAKSFYMINPKRMFLLTLLYYSVAMFNQQFLLVRSGLAAALYIYGISYFVRDNKAKFVLSGIVSFLIHRSSIVPFALAYCLKRRLTLKIIVLLPVLVIIANYFSNYSLAGLEFILRIIGSHYSDYFVLGDRYTEEGKVINTAFLVLLFIFVYLIIRFGNPRWFVTSKKIIRHQDTPLPVTRGGVIKLNNIPAVFINMAILFTVVNIAFPYPGIVSRLNLYLLMPVWIFMVYVTSIANKYVSYVLILLMIVYSFVAISTIVSDPGLIIFHKYQSWLVDPSLNFDACSTENQY